MKGDYKKRDGNVPRVLSSSSLLNTIGWIAFLLPVALALGNWLIFHGDRIENSISHYYFTPMRNLFVGALCAVGLLMIFYLGYDKKDHYFGNIAGFFAFTTAFFPTEAICGIPQWVPYVHFGGAAILFLILCYFCFFLFVKTRSGYKVVPNSKKYWRNVTYRTCGCLMLTSILSMCMFFIFRNSWDPDRESSFVFFGETTALVAFGWAWLVKGLALPTFRDRNQAKKRRESFEFR